MKKSETQFSQRLNELSTLLNHKESELDQPLERLAKKDIEAKRLLNKAIVKIIDDLHSKIAQNIENPRIMNRYTLNWKKAIDSVLEHLTKSHDQHLIDELIENKSIKDYLQTIASSKTTKTQNFVKNMLDNSPSSDEISYLPKVQIKKSATVSR